jgi:hypothetical protein
MMPQHGWLDLWFVPVSLLKLSLVLLSMYGLGRLFKMLPIVRTRFAACPPFALGMLAHVGIAVILSLAGALTRSLLRWLLLPGALFGLLRLLEMVRSKVHTLRLDKRKILHSILALPVLWLLVLGALSACRPCLEERDPLITYAVQPDRWLDEGRIHFLDETVFSAFPILGETIALWPASLASDMLEQLVLLQLFQRALLVLAVIIGASILRIGGVRLALALFVVLSCNLLFGLSGSAKVDMTALFFCTTALGLLLAKDGRHARDYSAFLLMGLALATKLTAYVVLLPFAVIVLSNRQNKRPKRLLGGAAALLFFPAVFAVRTAIHTGSPFYPNLAPDFLTKPEWQMPELHPLLEAMVDRTSGLYSSYGLLGNILELLKQWELPLILFVAVGLTSLIRKSLRRDLPVVLGILGFLGLSVAVYWPPWWGAKYTVLVIPFAALWAISKIRVRNWVPIGYLLSSYVLFFALFSTRGYAYSRWELSRGTQLVESFVCSDWRVEGKRDLYVPPSVPMQLWCNPALPEDIRIVSLWDSKRYFSQHEWIAAWRHPQGRALFLSNTLEEEVEILRWLETDYVVFGREDPLPLSAENELLVLNRIGIGDVLVPRLVLNHFLLCRFQPENLHREAEYGVSPSAAAADAFAEERRTVILGNALSGKTVAVLFGTFGNRPKGNLLQQPLSTGAAEALSVPLETEQMIAYDDAGGCYLLHLPQEHPERPCSVRVSLADRCFSSVHRGIGSNRATIRNGLVGLGLEEIRLSGDPSGAVVELLRGHVLFPGETLTLWTDLEGSRLTAVDQRGRPYSAESGDSVTVTIGGMRSGEWPDSLPPTGCGTLVVANFLPSGHDVSRVILSAEDGTSRDCEKSALAVEAGAYGLSAFDNFGIAYDVNSLNVRAGDTVVVPISVMNMRVDFRL